MASPIDSTTLAYAEHLAGLSTDAERSAAEQQKRVLVNAALPDDAIGRAPVRTLGAYLDEEIIKPPILVEPGLVARGAISALIARGGRGKTTLSLNRLIRWSMGRPLFDDLEEVMVPIRPLRILVIENEGAAGHFQQKVRTIVEQDHFTSEEREVARGNVHIWKDGGWSGLKIDQPADLDLVKRGVSQTRADIVFLEPFRGLHRGDENSSTDMARVLDSLEQLANECDCGVMICHHENKGGGGEGELEPLSAARGSSALEGTAAVMERWKPVKSGQQRELSQIKWRFDDPYAPIRLEYDRPSEGYRWVSENEGFQECLAALTRAKGDWMSVGDVAFETSLEAQTVRRWLNKAAGEAERQVHRVQANDGSGHRFRSAANGTARPGALDV